LVTAVTPDRSESAEKAAAPAIGVSYKDHQMSRIGSTIASLACLVLAAIPFTALAFAAAPTGSPV
jgi:hypothetical protein